MAGSAAGHGRRARVRDVGQEGAEGDDQLDAELLCVLDDQVAEGSPAHVGLDAQEQHDVTVEPMRLGVVEGRLGPVDLARDPVDERDVRPGRLEVEKALRIDVRDLVGPPQAREVAPASDAACAPSFQPRKAATSTGRVSSGRAETRSSGSAIPEAYAPLARRPGGGRQNAVARATSPAHAVAATAT